MSDSRAAGARDYRMVRGLFALFFAGLLTWIVARYEIAGWPLVFAVFAAISCLINLMQAILGPD